TFSASQATLREIIIPPPWVSVTYSRVQADDNYPLGHLNWCGSGTIPSQDHMNSILIVFFLHFGSENLHLNGHISPMRSLIQ
ncbi:MAG: hypothetical protein ACRD47_08040, partial [Nitrososphaeraceae archaeon]